MKTKILIDFDGTIFNTGEFKLKLFEALSNLGFSKDEIMEAYQEECLDKHFSLDDMVSKLRKTKRFNVESELKHVNEIYSSAPKLIFADFNRFIESIDRNKYEVNLLTLGDIEFQKKKVESSKVMKNFDHLYFTAEDKAEYIKNLVDRKEKFFLVDDRSDTIEKVSKIFPNSVALWINRKSKDFDDPTLIAEKCHNQVKSFIDVKKYLAE